MCDYVIGGKLATQEKKIQKIGAKWVLKGTGPCVFFRSNVVSVGPSEQAYRKGANDGVAPRVHTVYSIIYCESQCTRAFSTLFVVKFSQKLKRNSHTESNL